MNHRNANLFEKGRHPMSGTCGRIVALHKLEMHCRFTIGTISLPGSVNRLRSIAPPWAHHTSLAGSAKCRTQDHYVKAKHLSDVHPDHRVKHSLAADEEL
ncbi:MAG: hypothetical protein OXC27_02655, partial [Caldilineaceae bacterium]|nr:hypothetical protein [Caldilineaceae bacterium]